jgi:hypothetical protein
LASFLVATTFRDRLLGIFYVNKDMISLIDSEFEDLFHLFVEFKKIVAEVNKPLMLDNKELREKKIYESCLSFLVTLLKKNLKGFLPFKATIIKNV